jgi:hypothetical protein
MTTFRTIIAASALAAIASLATAAAQAAPVSKESGVRSTELSATKRVYHRRYVRHYYVRPYDGPRYSAYLRGPDPALGPDGRPYGPPPHLRGQCYIDEGYGRFSACPSR